MTNRFPNLVTRLQECEDKRARRPGIPWSGILIHHTGVGTKHPEENDLPKWDRLLQGTLNWLTAKDKVYVSAHFIVSRTGVIHQLVDPEYDVAFHAGESQFWNPVSRKIEPGCNDRFVGVELIGDGNLAAYPDEQYEATAKLCRSIFDRYTSINPICIVGHENVAPGRKEDPGAKFDWRHFFRLIFTEKPL
jgi:N-acetyl-anhydromuramyl-L-alanine amidase AmpD